MTMAEIERKRDTMRPAERVEFDRTDFSSISDVDFKKPRNPLSSDYLSTLVTVVRRPPELLFQPTITHGVSFEEVALKKMDPILNVDTDNLAFHVAELVVRRENEVVNSGDLGAQKGLYVMSEMARMFEHLSTMQTQRDGYT